MAIRKSVRIYDLARELKQDTKRVMEDLRRAGADVSVASNSVSSEFAEKVRAKYFPKAEIAPKRAIKVIKATRKDDAASDDAETEHEVESTAPVDEPTAAEPIPATETPATPEAPVVSTVKNLKKVLKPVEVPVVEPEIFVPAA
ncbi:MAG: translation initiation factor IF-2 N-terminal domain-containing protein, partial [Acidobacteriota bacterium]